MMYRYIAGSYDELHGKEQLRKLRVAKSLLNISSDDVVLDIGCGTGLSNSLGCAVVGVDNCQQMVDVASSRIDARLTPAEKLPFNDKSFTKLICMTALHNFNDPLAAVKEMKRVCDGQAVISLLKKAGSHDHLLQVIKSQFSVIEIVEDLNDNIFLCRC